MDAKKRPYFPVLPAALLTMPLLIIYCSEIITRQHFGAAAAWLFGHLPAAAFEYVLLLAASAAFFAVFRRLWAAFLFPAAAALLLTLINYYKIVVNGVPLLVSDFSFAGNTGTLMDYALPQLTLSAATAAALVLTVAAAVGFGFLDRRCACGTRLRFALGAAGAFYFTLLLYGAFHGWCGALTEGMSNQEERVDKLGVVTGLCCAVFSDTSYHGADAALVNAIYRDLAAAPAPKEPAVKPTVIFLMSESFFDVTRMENVTFATDPLPNFHRLSAEATSGAFLSNTFSGGTGYVEMEVLTGLCSNLLNEADTLTSFPNALYDQLPCINDVFRSYGYCATFLHAHTDELYNRRNIYDRFGFDRILFCDDFPSDAERSGWFYSDQELTRQIIAAYESGGDAPQFISSISMENHQPFIYDKYGADTYSGVTSSVLSEEGVEVLSAYTTGASHADAALGELVDYFADCGKPVMLVFWGDHMPNLNLSSGSTVYTETGYNPSSDTTNWDTDDLQKMLTTDYLIWTNYETAPAPDHTESCLLLGADVLDRLGFSGNDYYTWLTTTLRPQALLYRARLFVDQDGASYSAIPVQSQAVMEEYKALVRNYVYGSADIFAREERK